MKHLFRLGPWLVAGALSAAGCATTPRAAEDFAIALRVQPDDRISDSAELTLLEDGTWSLQADRGKDWRWSFEVGEIAHFRGESGQHLFVVVQSGKEQLRLQRLDLWPLRGSLRGQLAPLSPDESDERVCMGQGAFEASACAGAPGARWSIFPLSASEGTLALASSDEGKMRLPYRRAAVVDVAQSGTRVEGAPVEGAWLALASPTRRGRFAAAPRIAISTTCAMPETTLASSARFVPMPTIEESPSPHPVAIESRAIIAGADALVRCPTAREALVEMPSITRPLMAAFDDRLLGPPNFAMAPRHLPTEQLRAWSLSAAFGAVGDWELAAFWAERAIAASPEDRSSEANALLAMDMLATGGAIEAALRVAHYAGRDVWNRANIPDLLDGAAVIHAQLAQADRYLERVARQQALASSRRDDDRLAWYRWSELRRRHAARTSSEGLAYREYVVGFEDDRQQDWALAIWTMLGMHAQSLPGVDDPTAIRARFENAGALALWQATFAPEALESCTAPSPHQSCTATSYGLRQRADEEAPLSATLGGVPALGLGASFRVADFDPLANALQSPLERAEMWIALLPLTSDAEASGALGKALEATAEIAHDTATLCEQAPTLRWHFANAARRGDRPLLGRERRQWVEFVAWWASDGVDALCQSPNAFIAALKARPESSRAHTRYALSVLDARYRAASVDGVEVEELNAAAVLAASLGAGDTCARWNLALTLAAAQRGHVQLAGEHLVRATNCAAEDASLRAARDLIAAYIEFERSAGKRGFDRPSVGGELQAMTRRTPPAETCVGLVPLNFDLERYLPASLHELASRIALEDVSADAFSVLTASHLISEARAGFAAGTRALARGDALSAARALHGARAHFRALEHRPGTAAVGFLDDLIFDNQLDAMAIADEEQRAALVLPDANIQLRNGRVASWLESLAPAHADYGSPAHLAALLIVGRREDAALIAAQHTTSLPPLLCAPESGRP